MPRRCFRTALLFLALAAAPAPGWNAHGHRTITRLALDGLSPGMPAWLREPDTAARIADQANEPDRWRGVHKVPIRHDSNPEHYLDIEDLDQYGITMAQLPEHRYEAVSLMVRARVEHPERMRPIDKDPDKVKAWPGFLPWAMTEHYAKLQSSFNTLRVLEAINDPARTHQLRQARENVIYEMGILSHFVGDACQPLHTTRHHHGWVGENPNNYTTDNGFHAYIDGRILEIHRLDYDALKGQVKFDRKVSHENPWRDCLDHIQRSFDRMVPLYEAHKDGSLTSEPGKAFISERLADGASMLAALYNAAWEASTPTDADVASFIRYSEMRTKRGAPKSAPDPAGNP